MLLKTRAGMRRAQTEHEAEMVFGPVNESGLFLVFAVLAISARLNVNDLGTIVSAAVRAHAVRHLQFFAL